MRAQSAAIQRKQGRLIAYARSMEDSDEPQTHTPPAAEPPASAWAGWWRALPPLLLLPMLIQPPDFGSVLLWLVGWVAAAISGVRLLSLGAQLLIARARARPRPLMRPVRLLRQSLTVVLVIGAGLVLGQEKAVVAAETAGLADALNQHCQAELGCPVAPQGWPVRTDGSMRQSVGDWMHFLLIYRVSEDRQRFSLSVRWALDDALIFEGGVGLAVTSEHRID
jgi:hypothetical protein